MADIIRMANMVKAGTIRKWLKQEGEPVLAGEPICLAAGGKMTAEIASPRDGVLLAILAPAGTKVPSGSAIGIVGEEGEEITPLLESLPKAAEADSDAEKQKKEQLRILVIGGGPGGYVAAIRAAQLGADVTLAEKAQLGGTCLNRGCIPTKALLHSASLYEEIAQAGRFGIRAEKPRLDWPQVMAYQREVTGHLRDGIAGLMEEKGIRVVPGEAVFSGEKTVEIQKSEGGTEEIRADRILIACGSEPVRIPIPGAELCITSDEALALDHVPESMVIIGGGVIGVELASAFARFGTKVSVVEMLPRLMPMMDGELTRMAQEELEDRGISFYLEAGVQSVADRDGLRRVKLRRKDGSECELSAETVLMAVGRRPATGALKPEQAGILTERGKICVNNRMETNVPGIYAFGDCIGKTMLAHTASAMGETAAENAAGKRSVYEEKTCPSCVFLDPDLAGVGWTEEQAEASGRRYKVGRFPFAASGKARIMGQTSGMVKVIADARSGHIFGIHIFGPHASDLIGEAALAIRMGADLNDLITTIHAHPTLTESLREAALAADGRAVHAPGE